MGGCSLRRSERLFYQFLTDTKHHMRSLKYRLNQRHFRKFQESIFAFVTIPSVLLLTSCAPILLPVAAPFIIADELIDAAKSSADAANVQQLVSDPNAIPCESDNLDPSSTGIRTMVISPIGKTLFTVNLDKDHYGDTSPDGIIRVWRLPELQVTDYYYVPHEIKALSVSPDGNQLVAVGGRDTDGWITIIDQKSGKARSILAIRSNTFYETLDAIDISSDNQWAISVSKAGRIQVWDLSSQSLAREHQTKLQTLASISIDPRMQFFLVGTNSGYIEKYRFRDGTRIDKFKVSYKGIWNTDLLRILPDSQHFVAYGSSSPEVWSIPGRRIVSYLDLLDTAANSVDVTSIDISDDGSQILLGKDDATVEIWDWEQRKRTRKLEIETSKDNKQIIAIFSNNDQQLIIGTRSSFPVPAGIAQIYAISYGVDIGGISFDKGTLKLIDSSTGDTLMTVDSSQCP